MPISGKNELLSLSNEYYSLEYRNVGEIGSPGVAAWTHRYYEGGSIGNIHGFIYEGIDSEGKWIFKDTDGVEGITIEDRTDIGNGIPKFYCWFNQYNQVQKLGHVDDVPWNVWA